MQNRTCTSRRYSLIIAIPLLFGIGHAIRHEQDQIAGVMRPALHGKMPVFQGTAEEESEGIL
jgi:hypothetical protein